jgi:hypothetical protein
MGRRSGLVASCVSAASVATGAYLVSRAAQRLSAGSESMQALAAFAFSPVLLMAALALLTALVLLNLPIASAWDPAYRVLAATAFCVVAILALVLASGQAATFGASLERLIENAIVKPFRAAIDASGAADSFDASALAVTLDTKELSSSLIEVMIDSFAALVFFAVGGAWRIGNRLSGTESHGRSQTAPIEELRLPYPLLWAFLVSWSLVFAAYLLRAPAALNAVAWNGAITLSFAYAAQGLGIFTFLFKKWNMPRSLRLLIAALAFLSMAGTIFGIVVAVALPLFGVTEIWIHYRKPKGVGA